MAYLKCLLVVVGDSMETATLVLDGHPQTATKHHYALSCTYNWGVYKNIIFCDNIKSAHSKNDIENTKIFWKRRHTLWEDMFLKSLPLDHRNVATFK